MKNKSKILVLSAIALLGMTAAVAPTFTANNKEIRSVIAQDLESTLTFSSAPNSGDTVNASTEDSAKASYVWTTDSTYIVLESNAIHTGSGSKTCSYQKLVSNSFSKYKIKSVVVDAQSNNKAKIEVKINNTSIGVSGELTTTHSEYTFNNTEEITGGSLEINISMSSGKKNIYLYSVKVTYEEVSNAQLSSLNISDAKTTYFQGDSLVMPTVTATYDDNTTKDVTSKAVFISQDTSSTGQKTVQISYTENNITKTVNYTYTVQADELSSLTLGGEVKGSKGQDWDLSGVTLTGTFTSGNKTITGFTPTTETAIPTANGAYSVTVNVSYGGKTASKTFDVVVKATGLTEEDAFSVSEALDIINGFKGTSTKNNGQDVYVKGTVKDGISISTSSGSAGSITFNLTDGTQTIVAYSLWKEDAANKVKWTAGELNVGDKVIVHGYLIDYVSSGNHKAEIGYATGSLAWAKIVRNTQSITKTLTGCSLDVAATFDFDSAFSATLVANAGYELPESITMTVGGESFTDFTYNNQTGAISIAAGKVNGALVITGVATKINYTVATNLTGVILEELPETAQYGETLETTFALAEGCVNPQVKVMNNNVDVTEDAYDEGNSKITLTVQGNVEITITATPNDLASIAFVEGTDMTKKSYIASEEWDFSGLEVEGVMSSGDKIPLDDVTFTADKTVAEAPTSIQVTATYNDKTAVLTINGITVTPVSLASITATPSQDETTFTMGEEFKADNLVVTGVNNDGSTVSAVEGYSVDSSAFNTYAPGTYTIVVTKDALTTSYEVEVVVKELPTVDCYKTTASTTEFKAGDTIIITSSDSEKVLSTTQASNNRTEADISVANNTATINDKTQIITLEAGTSAGTFAFNVGNGYLYAASGSSNHLKTQSNIDGNASWKITIGADGTASVVAQGSNSRNVLQYNSGASCFSCYSSASQGAIRIYKNTPVATGKGDLINLASATLKGEPDLKIGDKLSVSDIEVKGLLNTNEEEKIESGFTFDNANNDGTVTLTQATNTITVKYNGFSVDMVVAAREPTITDETTVDVATSEDKTVLYGGETTQLFALLSSGEGEPDNKEVTWSSSNEDIATVDQNGLVTTKVVDADNTKVTITATPEDGGTAGSIELTVNKDDITGIELASAPAKVSYKYGEAFSAAGLAVKCVYESGKKSDAIAYDSSTFTLSVADGTTLDHSMTSVDVTYGGYTINNAFTLTIGKIATSLAVEDYNAIVYEGQEYSLGDLAKATVTYSDNSTSEVTIPSDNVTVDTSTAGDVQGTASITIDGVTVSATLDVRVKEDKVTSIQFLSGAANVEYDHHEAFNPEGIVIKVIYESGANEEVQYNDSRLSYNVTTLDTVGDQTITATFEDAHGNTASADMGQKVKVSKTISKVETTSYEVYKDYNAAGTNTPVSGDIYQSDNITVKAVITTTYSDGTTKQVTKLVSFGSLVEGENTATTTVDGVTLTYKIENVIGVELSSLILDTTNVTKTGYIEGQTADLSGLVVKAHYNNGADVVLEPDQYTVEGTTGLGVGQNTITVSYAGKSATFMVTANQKQVASVELVGTQAETYLTEAEIASLTGNGYQLKVNYDNNTSETIDITREMVSVNGNTVTVTYSGKTATYTIVALNAASASSITLENATGTTTFGDSYSFNPGTVTAHFNGTDKTITLEAGTYTVDAVDTSVPGQATYYVTVTGTTIKAAFTVTVNYADPTGVAISGNTTQVYKPGQTVQLSATVNPDNAPQAVTWSSSNTGVATVDANGLVTFKGYGEVTITATTSNGKTTTVTLTCANPVTSVTLNKETLEMDLEENCEATLVATVNPTDAETTNITWTSSDESIVSVDSSGNLIANNAGTAVITASCGGKEATCTVTVTGEEVEPITPVNPDNPSSGNTGVKVGCVGSVAASTLVVSLAAAAGAAMLVSKKRKEDK
ncbi:MAG: bacterial Ig-like domain-containing protein [Bacilli bacterium]|nr:bacterial Ig-like domain-containing protein [Bacilli bacterium]